MSNEMKPETPLDAAWAEYVQELNTFAARNAFDAGYRAGEKERSDCVENETPLTRVAFEETTDFITLPPETAARIRATIARHLERVSVVMEKEKNDE